MRRLLFVYLAFLWLQGCSVEKEAPVTIFEGVIVNDDTGEPVDGVNASLNFQGCNGFILGCIVTYNYSADDEGAFFIKMPYCEYEKEKNIGRYVLTVTLNDDAGNHVPHQLVSCGAYDDCSSFLAGKKYVFEYRYKLL